MKAVIFLNGNAPTPTQIKTAVADGNFVICADGAFTYLNGIIVPNLILGDFDSVNGKNFPKDSEIIEFLPEKDYTDGELCVIEAVKRGYNEIEIYGAGGGRPDHEYANYGLLCRAKQLGATAKLYIDEWEITLIDGAVSKEVVVGNYVSMVPLGEFSHIIRTEGLKYSAHNVSINRAQSLGVSNQAVSKTIAVEVKGETLLFIQGEKK